MSNGRVDINIIDETTTNPEEMPEIKRVTLHPLNADGSIDLDVNLYPKTLLDGIVDRQLHQVDVALKEDIPTDVVTHAELNTKVDKVAGSSLVPDTKVEAYDEHLLNVDNPHNVTKEQVGLSEVDNKSEETIKSDFTGSIAAGNTGFVLGRDVYRHTSNVSNPHGVTKEQVGLGNVDNTSDLNKPISAYTQDALDLKEDKSNKVTSISSSSTNIQYPSAKSVYDILNNNNVFPYVVYGDTNIYTFVDEHPEIANKIILLKYKAEVFNSGIMYIGQVSYNSYGGAKYANFKFYDVGTNKIYYGQNKEIILFSDIFKNTNLVEFESLGNKVTSLSTASTNTQYPSAKSVWDECQNIREVAEGKCKTLIIDDTITTVGPISFYDINGILHSYTEFEDFVSGYQAGNPLFNSIDDVIYNIGNNPSWLGTKYYFIFDSLGNEYVFPTTDKVVVRSEELYSFLRTGDIILVKQTDVPDRWYAKGSMQSSAYKLETEADLLNIQNGSGVNALQQKLGDHGPGYDNPFYPKPDTFDNLGAQGKDAFVANGNSMADGRHSTALGRSSYAHGQNAIAVGNKCVAASNNSLAGGSQSYAANTNGSIAFGDFVQAIGRASVATGGFTIAGGDYSHAEGRGYSLTSTKFAIFTGSIEANSNIIQLADDSEVLETYESEWLNKVAMIRTNSDNQKPTFIYKLIIYFDPETKRITLDSKVATAYTNVTIYVAAGVAGSAYAHVEGAYSNALGVTSHAEGSNTLALGTNSHTQGEYTRAVGQSSSAAGSNNIAGYADQFVVGHWNDNQLGNLFEVGNGHGIGYRRNAFEVSAEGTALLGNASIQNNNRAVVTKLYADTKVTANSAISSGTACKISYDSKGLVTGGTSLSSSDIPSLDASKITTGVFQTSQIPNLSASKITSGIFQTYQIPDLNTNKITSGLLPDSRIASASTWHNKSNATNLLNGSGYYALRQNGEYEVRTSASGEYSFAIGRNTEATGRSSFAEGYLNVASGENSHAEGRENTVSNNNAHVEGYNNTVSGIDGHAEGRNNTVSASASHAEGGENTVSAPFAHAEGEKNTIQSTARDSSVTGSNNIVAYPDQLVAGHWNNNTDSSLFEVGNGTSQNRSNAFTVFKDNSIKIGNTTLTEQQLQQLLALLTVTSVSEE